MTTRQCVKENIIINETRPMCGENDQWQWPMKGRQPDNNDQTCVMMSHEDQWRNDYY